MSNNTALLIIDMQNGCFAKDDFRYDSEAVIERINCLAQKFRAAVKPVIFIQQNSARWKQFVAHTDEWKLLPELDVQDVDIKIDKTANDAFYQSELGSTLKSLDVNSLTITGFATEFCVNATVLAALNLDYDVTVVKNGHTTGNKPHLEAEKIIEHHNWLWQNMIPTQGQISVVNYEELELVSK